MKLWSTTNHQCQCRYGQGREEEAQGQTIRLKPRTKAVLTRHQKEIESLDKAGQSKGDILQSGESIVQLNIINKDKQMAGNILELKRLDCPCTTPQTEIVNEKHDHDPSLLFCRKPKT